VIVLRSWSQSEEFGALEREEALMWLRLSLSKSKVARSIVLAVALATHAGSSGVLAPASAQDLAPCDQFTWSVKREQTLFGAADLQKVASGVTLGSLSDQAIALELQPHGSVPYVLPPGRQPKMADSSGGLVVVSNVPKASQYQITASAEAWIDVIQNGKALASTAHTGRRDCPNVRKSVRFDLQPGSVTIQVSGVDSKLIKLAILPVE
jgi:hypothetical protein